MLNLLAFSRIIIIEDLIYRLYFIVSVSMTVWYKKVKENIYNKRYKLYKSIYKLRQSDDNMHPHVIRERKSGYHK